MLRTAETAMLNHICSEQFLKTFSRDLQDWKKLAPYFSIHEWNSEELVYNYPDENDQKYQALLCWKRAEGSAATYYNLLESLILHGNITEVEALLQRLREGTWPNYNNYRMCMSMYHFIASCRTCGTPCQQVAEAAVPGSQQLAAVERSSEFNTVWPETGGADHTSQWTTKEHGLLQVLLRYTRWVPFQCYPSFGEISGECMYN